MHSHCRFVSLKVTHKFTILPTLVTILVNHLKILTLGYLSKVSPVLLWRKFAGFFGDLGSVCLAVFLQGIKELSPGA